MIDLFCGICFRESSRLSSPSTHFHRKLIRAGSEFESRMSHLLEPLHAWNDDFGYYRANGRVVNVA